MQRGKPFNRYDVHLSNLPVVDDEIGVERNKVRTKNGVKRSVQKLDLAKLEKVRHVEPFIADAASGHLFADVFHQAIGHWLQAWPGEILDNLHVYSVMDSVFWLDVASRMWLHFDTRFVGIIKWSHGLGCTEQSVHGNDNAGLCREAARVPENGGNILGSGDEA
jgi:hypothetical protein